VQRSTPLSHHSPRETKVITWFWQYSNGCVPEAENAQYCLQLNQKKSEKFQRITGLCNLQPVIFLSGMCGVVPASLSTN
jgi:hypothetical protein